MENPRAPTLSANTTVLPSSGFPLLAYRQFDTSLQEHTHRGECRLQAIPERALAPVQLVHDGCHKCGLHTDDHRHGGGGSLRAGEATNMSWE